MAPHLAFVTHHDRDALMACAEFGIDPEVYRGVALVEVSDGWIGTVDGLTEFEAASRDELLVEIDDTLPPEPVEEGEPMVTFIPACNRVWL